MGCHIINLYNFVATRTQLLLNNVDTPEYCLLMCGYAVLC